jgi:Na+/alanine symporter
MESLALVVAMLLALTIFTGPISLVLTSKLFWNYSRRSKWLWVFRRILVATISPLGMTVALFFIFTPIPVTPKIVAAFGLSLNVIAVKREFFRNKPWPRFIKPSMRDPNGPAGQS